MNGFTKARTIALAGAGIAGGLLTVAPSGVADQSDPTFNCRASAVWLDTSPPLLPRIEPLVANGSSNRDALDRPACADDSAEVVPQLTQSNPLIAVDAITPRADTSLTPDLGAARDQTATSATTVANATVSLGGGALTVNATAVTANAEAKCVSGVPTLSGASRIGSLSINGMAIDLDDPVTQIATAINGTPLKGLVEILPNQEVRTGTTLTRRALEVRVLSALGTPLATAVLGEAKVATSGAVCAPASTPPTVTVTVPGGTPPPGTGTNTNGNGSGSGSGSNGSGTTGGSDTGAVKAILLNGTNGGCGRIATLTFTKSKKRTITSRFGARQVLRGRLVSCAGKSIVGARLDVTHSYGKRKLVKTGVKTRAAGRFTLILPLDLSSRTIRFAYRGNLNSARVVSSRSVVLTVVDRFGKKLVKK